MKTASGSKPGIDATKKMPGEGFKRAWPPLIKMDENGRKKMAGGLFVLVLSEFRRRLTSFD